MRRSPPLRAGARPVAESTDKALIKAIGRGDRTAMQALYGRHNVRVTVFSSGSPMTPRWRKSWSATCSSQCAPSRAFRRTVAGLNVDSGDRPPQGLFGRRRRPHEQPLSERIADTVVDPADDAEAMIVHDDRSAALQTCLAKLSPEHREVIDLAYYHDKTVDEVAEITGVPKNTVKTRMFYARKCLAKLLATSEGVDDDLRARALH